MGYHVSLAKALLDSGDLGGAGQALESVDPSNPTAYVLRRQIQLMQGQKVDVEQLLAKAQSTERSALAVAMQYLDNQQLQTCVQYCLDELAKHPEDADLRLLLGRAYLSLGKEEQGIAQWEQVLQKAPDRLSTYLELASILSRDRNVEQVIERMSHIPGARIDMINLAIGRMVAAMGDYDRAAVYLRKVAQRQESPEHVRGRASLLLAQSLFLGRHPDEALDEYDRLAASAFLEERGSLRKGAGAGGAEAERAL